MAGAVQVARRMTRGTIVVLLPDRGDRYLSTGVFGQPAVEPRPASHKTHRCRFHDRAHDAIASGANGSGTDTGQRALHVDRQTAFRERHGVSRNAHNAEY